MGFTKEILRSRSQTFELGEIQACLCTCIINTRPKTTLKKYPVRGKKITNIKTDVKSVLGETGCSAKLKLGCAGNILDAFPELFNACVCCSLMLHSFGHKLCSCFSCCHSICVDTDQRQNQ